MSSHIPVLLADLIADGLREVAGEPGGVLREGVFTSETVLLIRCLTDEREFSPTENGDDGGGEVPGGAAGRGRRGLWIVERDCTAGVEEGVARRNGYDKIPTFLFIFCNAKSTQKHIEQCGDDKHFKIEVDCKKKGMYRSSWGVYDILNLKNGCKTIEDPSGQWEQQ
jgi:hypothetical protein